MEISKANKRRLIFWPILLIAGAVLLIFWKNAPNMIISGLMAGGLASTINGLYSHSKYGVQAESDERTRKAVEKASLYAFLILVGCLFLLSGAYILDGTNSFLLGTKDSPWTPLIVAHIGIYSWGILAYYFVKNGDAL